ncbi:MAG: SnoaL-like domain-containing protein [Phycisphaerales bacterium]
MAKKKAKPVARAKSAPMKIGKKTVGKKPSAGNKPAPKLATKRRASNAPKRRSEPTSFTVSTGKGPGAAEIGASLVALYNAGRWDEPANKWYAPEIVSVEGSGMACRGREALEAKAAWWYGQNRVLGGSAEGPYVGASGFSVKYRIEVQEKKSGTRVRMEEVGVYTVQGGKIVREEYMYGPMQREEGPAGG